MKFQILTHEPPNQDGYYWYFNNKTLSKPVIMLVKFSKSHNAFFAQGGKDDFCFMAKEENEEDFWGLIPSPVINNFAYDYNSFGSERFNPGYYEGLSQAINEGKKVVFQNNLNRITTCPFKKICSTKDELDSVIYDIFIEEIEKYHDEFVFGLGKRKNKIKDPVNIYYDGIVFGTVRNEYINTLKDYTPERILSLIYHFGILSEDKNYGSLVVEIV